MKRRERLGARGFTVVELIVAIVLLSVVVVALAASSLYTSRALLRSSEELRASEFTQGELERLLSLPYGSLADGSQTLPQGTSTWTVVDSTTYRRIVLVTHYAPTAAISVWDTATAYRIKP